MKYIYIIHIYEPTRLYKKIIIQWWTYLVVVIVVVMFFFSITHYVTKVVFL